MKVLDYPVYKKMENLKQILEKQNKNKNLIEDIQYKGSIDWINIDPITQAKVTYKIDIYACTENKANGEKILKYYDERNNLIAIDMHDGRGIIPTEKTHLKMPEEIDFYSQFNKIKFEKNDSLKDFENSIQSLCKETNISREELLVLLKEKNNELEKISESTGIAKDEIEEISITKLINKNNPKKENKAEENKIEINSNKEKTEENTNNNQNSQNNPNIKQETDLSQKINDKFTLGDILGVSDGGKLVVVYSSAIKDNKSSTRFTFLIKDKTGKFSPCENLKLAAGNHPNNDIYASNYKGNIKKGHVNSEYRIKSPHSNERYILTATIGSYGSIDLGLGQAPRMQGLNNPDTNLITIPLKTTNTYNTKPLTKETLLSYHADKYAADKRNEEAQMHENKISKNDDKLNMYDVDGDSNTGKQYLSQEDMLQIIEDLKLFDAKSEEYTSKTGLLKDIIKYNLHGDNHPTKEQFVDACIKCQEEHPMANTRNK